MKIWKIRLLASVLWAAAATLGTAQYPYHILESFGPGKSFTALQDSVERYYATRDRGQGTGYKHWKRFEYWATHHLDSLGQLTNWAARNYEAVRQEDQQRMPLNGAWTSNGPTNYILTNSWAPGLGVVNCVAFHPTNGDVYVGTAGGGLWKGSYVGTTYSWTLLTNSIPVSGVSGIVIHPTSPNIIYILTGDGDGGDNKCIGVFRSNDGGLSWEPTGLGYDVSNNVRGFKLAARPDNANVLYAATNAGLLRSLDGGTNWTTVLAGIVCDFEFKPNQPNTMYASIFGPTIRYCNNAGSVNETWTAAAVPDMPAGANRVALAVTPISPSVVYALASPHITSTTYAGFFRSSDSGKNYTRKSNSPNILCGNTNGNLAQDQGQYDLAIYASLVTTNRVLTGGINIWKTTNAGTSFSCLTKWNLPVGDFQYTHADIHALARNPVDGRLYCGSDGGIYLSQDDGDVWTNISAGLNISAHNRLDVRDNNALHLLTGLYHNGVMRKIPALNWMSVMGGDGSNTLFPENDTEYAYAATQNGDLWQSADGGLNFYDCNEPAGGSWVAPFVTDPLTAGCIFFGTAGNVYHGCRTAVNGLITWTPFGGSAGQCLAAEGAHIYGSSGTQMTHYDGATWINLTEPWTQWVTGIAINPDNVNEVWVSLGGYTGSEKVFRSTNGGITWTNISAGLPNIPIQCIDFQDTNGSPSGAVYVGTDNGVYYRDNASNVWTPFRTGLPTGTVVADLEVHEQSGQVFICSFGHGIWSSPLYSPCPANMVVSTDQSGYIYHQASNSIQASGAVLGGFGTEVRLNGGNFVEMTPGFQTIGSSFFEAKTGPCSTGIPSIQTGNPSGQ